MKVAFVSHPVPGTSETITSCSTHIWIHEVARRLAGTNSAVVFTGRNPGDPIKVEWINGVQYRRNWIPSLSKNIRRLSRVLFKIRALRRLEKIASFRSRWHYFFHALRIAVNLRRQGCDVVHIINFSQFAPIFWAISPKTKVVLHMHCEWLTRLDHKVIGSRLKKVDRIISCSNFVTDQIRREFPAFADRCATVYNGVDLDLFTPGNYPRADEGTRVMFAGSVGPHKGLHILLDAFPDVVKEFPNVTLNVVGPEAQLPREWLPTLGDPEVMMGLTRFYDGRGYRSHLEDQMRTLNLAGHVIFSGFVSRAELAQHFREADLFVYPSLWNELFGMSIAEAMASGIPVVASRVAGIPEAVEDGKTGFLVEPGNPSALAKAILQLLSDANLRDSMAKAARKRVVENFSWEKIAADLVCEYRSLAGVPRRAALRGDLTTKSDTDAFKNYGPPR